MCYRGIDMQPERTVRMSRNPFGFRIRIFSLVYTSCIPCGPWKSAGALIVSSPHHLFESFLSPAETFFHDQLGDGKGGALPKPRMMTSHTDGWRLRRPSYGTGVRASPEAELSVREDGVSPLCPYQFPTMRIVFQMVGIAPAPDLSYNGGVQ